MSGSLPMGAPDLPVSRIEGALGDPTHLAWYVRTPSRVRLMLCRLGLHRLALTWEAAGWRSYLWQVSRKRCECGALVRMGNHIDGYLNVWARR